MPIGIYKRTPEMKTGKHMRGRVGFFTGKKHTEEDKKKMSEIRKANPNRYWLGKNRDRQTLDKMSKTMTGKLAGDKNPSWKGGISKLPDYKSFCENKRRAIKRANGGNHSFGDWLTLKAQYNWTCPCCSKSEPEIKLTQDHIIPISRGGSDNIENIQPLCWICNLKKHCKDTKYEKGKL